MTPEPVQEKPLHVRVAEALGWTECRFEGWIQYRGDGSIREDKRRWTGITPWQVDKIYPQDVPRYDTDWAATGPLIEKYHLHVEFHQQWWSCAGNHKKEAPCGWALRVRWSASDEYPGTGGACHGWGDTALEAVCELILDLKKHGKLKDPVLSPPTSSVSHINIFRAVYPTEEEGK